MPTLQSTMIGAGPHGHTEEALKTAAVDPSASVDLQTGAVIEKKSAEERKFVARLDAILLVYTCVSQVLKYLDQQKQVLLVPLGFHTDVGSISNAYVSGMQLDLKLDGNQYNYFTTWFNVGYAIFLIPSQIIITRVRPSLWLPCLEFAWGCLTLGLFKVTSAEQIYVIRAFIGCFEASCYPGALMLLMSWYTPREIALRIGFYHSCQSGWRWMFVIDAIMTLVWSLLGFVFIPDFPNKPNPWAKFWLKPHHIELAVARTNRFRRSANKKFTLATIKRTLKQPLFYFFCTLYPTAVLAQQGYNYFTLFLKSLTKADGTPTWSVAAVNAIPIGGAAIICVTVWVYAAISDYFQTRWLVVMGQAIFGLIPAIMLTIWDIPLGAKYFAYFATYLSVATAPPLFAWMSDMSPHDAEQRAFILGFSIAFYYAVGAWSNVLIWPTVQVPHYKYAWQTCIALWVLVIILLCALRWVELKYIRPRNRAIAEEKMRLQDAGEAADEDALLDSKYVGGGRAEPVASTEA